MYLQIKDFIASLLTKVIKIMRHPWKFGNIDVKTIQIVIKFWCTCKQQHTSIGNRNTWN